jgi:superfamily II DNA or RNA helicase
MKLLERLAPLVPKKIQTRGREYYHAGSVRILGSNSERIAALVRGTVEYRVAIECAIERIVYSCTCPYYIDQANLCKHVWATFLQAYNRGLLSGWNGREVFDLMPKSESPTDEPPGTDEGDIDDFAGEDEFDDSWERPETARRYSPANFLPNLTRPGRRAWGAYFDGLDRGSLGRFRLRWPKDRELCYVLDIATSFRQQGFCLEMFSRDRKKDGEWGKPRRAAVSASLIDSLPDSIDRRIVSRLTGVSRLTHYGADEGSSVFQLDQFLEVRDLVRLMCDTGRCFCRVSPDNGVLCQLRYDDGMPWEFRLRLLPVNTGEYYQLSGCLVRGAEIVDLSQPVILYSNGLVILGETIGQLEHRGAFDWISQLRKKGPMLLPAAEWEHWLERMLKMPHLPALDLPEELRVEEVCVRPCHRLRIRTAKNAWDYGKFQAELFFEYQGKLVSDLERAQCVPDISNKKRYLRDFEIENEAANRLLELGFRSEQRYGEEPRWTIAKTKMPAPLKILAEEGWQVELEGKLFRLPGALKIHVTSGIDWFELHGSVEFGDSSANLPELLAALKKHQDLVRLDDGSFGLIPEELLRKYGILAGLGTLQDDHLRFSRSQTGLLDALLAAMPRATCDDMFAQVREKLLGFEGIRPIDPPSGFVGQLRGYQLEGLGWLHFMREFGFGGCLADDMGLGKTVQVLALLESRRELRSESDPAVRPPPSLVVVPKSLIFNWRQEAARFTPLLRVLDHTGGGRTKEGSFFDDYDVILTTYGTLRRDALLFKQTTFDYVILDESQAVKNASTESAKAVRLLHGRHRLALSGTPIENHLGELWSLFEFLNPGMLGAASVFRLGQGELQKPDEAARALLAKALRPFILRRNKAQVARDLPEKLEQTIFCELEPSQRKLYNELRDHYRRLLLGLIERDGMNRAKIYILEALLRLRQAAIHPALIDKSRAFEASAKLDLLLPQLNEVFEEGHKALVFSQFTSMLDIIKTRLDEYGIVYECLDGRTHNRARAVDRFQNDPNCKLFLISLKAGGLGLNLTAAEYVFLLDPWWNPAVEAQAVDRTHRIGQTKAVFAYRLIARDTVEEKVLELQNGKRQLADAIISADNRMIRDLKAEDLQLLLS